MPETGNRLERVSEIFCWLDSGRSPAFLQYLDEQQLEDDADFEAHLAESREEE